MRIRRIVFIIAVAVLVMSLGLSIFVAARSAQRSALVYQSLNKATDHDASVEKLKQEAIALRIKNEESTMLLARLLTGLSSIAAGAVALSGAWLGVSQYFALRRRERLEALQVQFSELWKGIATEHEAQRVAGIAGLQMFLSSDGQAFHKRVVSALAVAARQQMGQQRSDVVIQTLVPAINEAVSMCPQVVRGVSWQGCRLPGVTLKQVNLDGIDLRGADLTGSDLSGASLRQAKLDGAVLTDCKLEGADLSNADMNRVCLTRAVASNAVLKNARITNASISDLDLLGADLTGAVTSIQTDWRLARNWRGAKLDEVLRKRLVDEHGPGPLEGSTRVLMLIWEFPPAVFGGQWTAVYHLLRNLQQRGANVVVLTAVAESVISEDVFGKEIAVLSTNSITSDSTDDSGAYYAGKRYLDLAHRFAEEAPRVVSDRRLAFDLIHAHDWLTFEAAEALAAAFKKPWVAHFHSIERDRTREPSHHIETLEQRAVQNSAHVVVPSRVTKERIEATYGVGSQARIEVAPNCLSARSLGSSSVGYRESRRVVFSGRFAHQKGPDIFVQISKAVWKRNPGVKFVMYGGGTEKELDVIKAEQDLVISTIPPEIIVPAVSSYKRSPVQIRSYCHQDASGTREEIHDVIQTPPRPLLVNATEDEREDYEIGREMWDRQKSFLNSLFASGFRLRALDEKGELTHELQVNGEQGRSGEKILVKVEGSGIRSVVRATHRVVEIEGKLPWKSRVAAFDDASVVVVPSRFEPYGMIVLEAMLHGVPVVFPRGAGVSERLRSGIRFDPETEVDAAVDSVWRLLEDDAYWREVVGQQSDEVKDYWKRGYEDLIQGVWRRVLEEESSSFPSAISP